MRAPFSIFLWWQEGDNFKPLFVHLFSTPCFLHLACCPLGSPFHISARFILLALSVIFTLPAVPVVLLHSLRPCSCLQFSLPTSVGFFRLAFPWRCLCWMPASSWDCLGGRQATLEKYTRPKAGHRKTNDPDAWRIRMGPISIHRYRTYVYITY